MVRMTKLYISGSVYYKNLEEINTFLFAYIGMMTLTEMS